MTYESYLKPKVDLKRDKKGSNYATMLVRGSNVNVNDCEENNSMCTFEQFPRSKEWFEAAHAYQVNDSDISEASPWLS